ncbi:hypothetical protein [Streptodolium elevatio]|uniref:Uncharacterized protein n=1 Tax=Streptodolium elevatio TaxID=3157996 RepID=A0ABV3DW17_9ACTN
MTVPARTIEELIGADRASLWAVDRAGEYTDRDLLDPDAALRWVWAQADAGDPLVLAGPGQVWRLPDGVDPDEVDAPARVLLIWARLEEPARVKVPLVSEDGTPGVRDELLVDVLRDYTLTTWMPWGAFADDPDPATRPGPAASDGET